jgi:NADH dehydrogenase
MSKYHVVIVGGGFGGVQTALKLSEDDRFIVTLITDRENFHYYPSLYRTATGGRRKISSIPLTEIFAGKHLRLLIDEAVSIDRDNRVVKTKVGHKVGYDGLVIGLGVQTNYFGIEGLKELSFGIKSPDDAEKLKAHLHKQLLQDGRPDNYVVVGGGSTGVELAGALGKYVKQIMKSHDMKQSKIHVDLIETEPRLLPRSPKDVSAMVKKRLKKLGVRVYLKTTVRAQTADALMVHNKSIRSHTVIWTAGAVNHPFFNQNEFQLNRQGKVRVDQFLQAEPGIYVIGDNADTPYSGTAQTAIHDGAYVAKNLMRIVDNNEPRPYVAKKSIYVFPAGEGWAAVLWGRVRLYGRIGWVLRSAADLIGYSDFEPWKSAAKRWLAHEQNEDSCVMCHSKKT